MIKNIIFDLDGTIANSSELMMSIADSFSIKYNYKAFGSNGLKKIRSVGTGKFISQIGIKKEDIGTFIEDISTELIKNYNEIRPVEGIIELIKELRSKNFFLGVVTTNQKDNALNFLNKFDINISFIYDKAGLLGKTKLLNDCLAEHHLNKNESVYVGDEDRDVLSAKESGLKSVAVTWGLTSKEVLLSFKPDFIISGPQELLNLLK